MGKNRLRRFQLVLSVAALALASSKLSLGQTLADQKQHVQTLIDQATTAEDNLGSDLINVMSLGGLEQITLGNMGPMLMDALDNNANNPQEPVDFISRLAGSTQSEESVAWCGANAIVAFNDSGSFVKTLLGPPPSPSFSFSFDGWSVSADGGKTFTDKGILVSDPLPPTSRFIDLFGDPVVGCTDTNTFYYASLANDYHNPFPTGGIFTAISVSKSTDGGQSFGGARIAVEKQNFTPVPFAIHTLDKDWMDVRRAGAADHIFVTYTDFAFFKSPPCVGASATIELVRSLDGGATWSAPVVIDTICSFFGFLQGSHVAIGNGSDVYVAYESYPTGTFSGQRFIKLRKSSDEGATFGPAVTVSSVVSVGSGFYVQGLFRDFLDFQGLAVDKSNGPNRGNVYITWQDGRNLQQRDPFSAGCTMPLGHYCFGDILFSRSTDGGAHWSPPTRVNDDPITLAVDQMFPAVDVDKDGKVVVVFYDRRRDARNFKIDTFTAASGDGGVTWANHRVTNNNFPAIHDEDVVVNSVYMGDYLGIAADRTMTHAGVIVAWGDNSLGDPNVVAAKAEN